MTCQAPGTPARRGGPPRLTQRGWIRLEREQDSGSDRPMAPLTINKPLLIHGAEVPPGVPRVWPASARRSDASRWRALPLRDEGWTMNILLWVLQAVLALLYLSGGAFKIFSFDEVAQQWVALPRAGWTALGALEVVGAVLLVVPAALKWMPTLTPVAAA